MVFSAHSSIKMLPYFLLQLLLLSLLTRAEVSAQETNQSVKASPIDDDAAASAEFRQGGGLGQQLLSVPASSIYGGNGYQQFMANGGVAAAAPGAGSNYGNMLRQLYRPSSFGLTDKVRNWVKSFLNRRQYVKPYYNPAALLSYGGGATGLEEKPIYINGVSYKPVSVPLRQIQKYFKPFYGGASAASASDSAMAQSAMAQYLASAASSPPRSPSGASPFGGDSGLYASESSGAALFSSGIPGFMAGPGSSGSSVFGSNSGLAGLGSSSSNGQLGSSLSFSPNGGIFSSSGGLYSTGGGFGSGGLSSNNGNIYSFGSAGGLGGGLDDLSSSSSSFYSSSGNGGNSGGSGTSSAISGIYGGLRNTETGSSYSVGGSQSDSQPNYSQFSVGGSPSESGYSSYDAGNYPVESAYSMTYQRPPQSPAASGKSYLSGSSFQDQSNFQPVSFGASDGSNSFKGISSNSNSNNGHHSGPSLSSSSSALYASEKSS